MSWRRVARAPGDSSESDRISGDTRAVSDDILASAIDDLAAGFTLIEVVDRYPEHAAELAPLLETAYDLRATHWPAMSMAGRVTGRERMHAALAQQKRRKAGFLSPFWRQAGVTVALMLMAGVAFLASPISPLDFPRGHGVTPTVEVPAVAQPAPTFTAIPPTLSPTLTWTATDLPTRESVATAEPSETPERLVLAERTRAATVTATYTASPTRRPARTSTVTPPPSATFAPTALPTDSGGAATQPPPSPTPIPPTTTPPPTRIKVTPTLTSRPTDRPEPTFTLTPKLPTPRPSNTPIPTLSPSPEPPTNTPSPEPTRTPRHTPRPSVTPGPSKTPRVGNALPDVPKLILTAQSQVRQAQSLQQEMRPVNHAGPPPAFPRRRP